jgi:hypothetical protein
MSEKTSERIFLRGETANFVVHFYQDAGHTIPMIPLDSAKYPQYTIFDINGNAVQSGVGSPEITQGRYKTDFEIPLDALLSSDLGRWRIEWIMVSDTNQQINFVEEFDIKDTVITASETREQKFITLIDSTYRAILRQPINVGEVNISIYSSTNMDTKVSEGSLTDGSIKYAADGDSIVYYYDIESSIIGKQTAMFSIIWGIRNTPIEPQSFVYQVLNVVQPYSLALVTSLRMIIDKLQKRLGTVQSYEDSDMIEYLTRGSELVNAQYPTTFFGYANMPQALTVHHIIYSAWYALQAQQLLNTELGFSFSGQSVTLDYDQSGGLGDLASRWQEFLTSTLPAAKMALVRRNSPVGVVAGRKYRWQDYNMYTYKVASVSGYTNQILGQMTTLGLLF